MKLQTFYYERARGWSSAFPDLDSDRTLVVVFGSADFSETPEPIDDLIRAFPRARIVGCSSAGEIRGPRVVDGSLSIAVARFEATDVATTTADIVERASSVTVGETIARGLARPDLRAIFVLSDGLAVNGTELLHGVHAIVPPSVIVTGGLAGDGTRFGRTWVLSDGVLNAGRVVGVGLYGDSIRISHGSRGGWDVFGPERIVTRSTGNVVYELDGEPALSLYKAYLGERAAGLPATALLFPLALRTSRDDADTVVRTILSVNEAEQSMTFAGDVPQESVVQLMRANFDRLIDGAGEASVAAKAPEHHSLSIAISCVGRRIVLGERVEEEVEAALEAAKASELVGFYSYGEISPFASGGCGVLHNQTMTVTRFWES